MGPLDVCGDQDDSARLCFLTQDLFLEKCETQPRSTAARNPCQVPNGASSLLREKLSGEGRRCHDLPFAEHGQALFAVGCGHADGDLALEPPSSQDVLAARFA